MKNSFVFAALILCAVACGKNPLDEQTADTVPQSDQGGYWYNGYYYPQTNYRGWQGQGAGAGMGSQGGGYYDNQGYWHWYQTKNYKSQQKNNNGYDWDGKHYVPNPGRYWVERYAPHALPSVPKYIPAPGPKEGYQPEFKDQKEDDDGDSMRDYGRSIGRYYRNKYRNRNDD